MSIKETTAKRKEPDASRELPPADKRAPTDPTTPVARKIITTPPALPRRKIGSEVAQASQASPVTPVAFRKLFKEAPSAPTPASPAAAPSTSENRFIKKEREEILEEFSSPMTKARFHSRLMHALIVRAHCLGEDHLYYKILLQASWILLPASLRAYAMATITSEDENSSIKAERASILKSFSSPMTPKEFRKNLSDALVRRAENLKTEDSASSAVLFKAAADLVKE